MSTNKAATKADLQEMYSRILPYLGGTANAGFTPVGTIISMMSNHAPANYLACDGATYNIADYPELANHFLNEFGSKNYFGGDGTTTFGVPDLKGEFLRGTGTNSHTNQGSGANVGVHQHATDMPFYTVQKSSTNTLRMINNSETEETHHNADSIYLVNGSGSISWVQLSGTSQATGNTKNAITVRPTNTSVLYCIAVKDIYYGSSGDSYTKNESDALYLNKSVARGCYLYRGIKRLTFSKSTYPNFKACFDNSALYSAIQTAMINEINNSNGGITHLRLTGINIGTFGDMNNYHTSMNYPLNATGISSLWGVDFYRIWANANASFGMHVIRMATQTDNQYASTTGSMSNGNWTAANKRSDTTAFTNDITVTIEMWKYIS